MQKAQRQSTLLTSGEASYVQQCKELSDLVFKLSKHPWDEDLFRSLLFDLHAIIPANTIACLIPYEDFSSTSWFAVNRDGAAPTLTTFPASPWQQALLQQVHETRQPILMQSLKHSSRFGDLVEQFRRNGNQSLCVLPLMTAIRKLGLICLGREYTEAFQLEELKFLKFMADYVALALDNQLTRAHSEAVRAQLESEKTKFQLVLDLNDSVVSNLELRNLLQSISPNIRKAMQLDAVGLILPESDGKVLRLYALDFPDSKGVIRQEMLNPPDGSIAGEVMCSGKLWVGGIEDLRGSEWTRKMALQEGIEALCFLPLIRRDKVLGILSLARLRKHSFTQRDLEFLAQIANQIAIAIDNALAYNQISELKERLTQEKLYFEDEIRNEMNFEEIVGNSPVLRRVLRQIETVAPTDSTVLIYGETGSGKELIARAVHNLSRRRSAAFVKLNCAAIPTGLLESELFGHEKGAFTGAIAQRIGRFELASDGTIFLDEIGEIPLELQPKLLRVLQEREFERLGGSRTLRTNARLIAATNQDLGMMVEEHHFRSDLFYRLNVFPIYVPPLRERREDIPLLVRHFAQHYSRNMNKQIEVIPTETMQALIRYSWPGNIRELQNVIERAVILSQGPVLNVPLSDLKPRGMSNQLSNGTGTGTLEEVERKHILAVLEQTNWVFGGPNGAAARLGIKRSTLQFRMQKLGIARPQRSEA